MTKSLINKSRSLGEKKRGRPPKPPKSDPVPEVKDSPVTPTQQTQQETQLTVKVTRVREQPLAFKGLEQVNNSLTFSRFDPNSYFATDLFKDTSKLERTTKENADELVQSIEEKRQTVRIATANLQLNQDVVRAGNEYLKLEGLAIDYATTGVNNETKFVNYQVAGVNKDIALNKLDQSYERLAQGQATLAGMQSITPLISQEWEQRKNLKLSQISSLKIEATKAREALEPKMMQLSQNFRQELEDLN